jgi:hypothetical protein
LAFHSGREPDHSPSSSTEVKEWLELCLHSPNAPSWRGAQLEGALYFSCFPVSSAVLTLKTFIHLLLKSHILHDVVSRSAGIAHLV